MGRLLTKVNTDKPIYYKEAVESTSVNHAELFARNGLIKAFLSVSGSTFSRYIDLIRRLRCF